ncbi:MAG: MBL fold metallo-hydrolase [Oscillospiraceae bacterium]|nr:MBL fold metallo-hydrolase [Oscillospiraceae bacterium]
MSLYIEVGNRKILFDAGQTDAFIKNASLVNVDLSAVDTAILSHGHYDHGDGFVSFLECNDCASIYLSEAAVHPFFNAKGKYIGLNPRLLTSNRLVLVTDDLDLGDGLRLVSCKHSNTHYPGSSNGLQLESNGIRQQDLFQHEQYLVIQENGRRYCFCGCAHRGVLNVLEWTRPDYFLGGFHFKDVPPDSAELVRIAQTMMELPTVFYTGHCTGVEQFCTMKSVMGQRLHYLSAGTVIDL